MTTAREALERQRAELVDELHAAERDLAELRAARGEANADDEHDPEGATLTGQWSALHGIAESLRARVAETDAALDRVAAGTYGTCRRCGRPIAPARLEARPSADLCIDCARLAAP